ARIAEIVSIHRDGTTLDLISPARIVAVAGNRQRKVRRASHFAWFAVVEAFEPGELIRVFLDEIGKTIQQAPTLGSAHPPPRSALESVARCRDCHVNIGRICFGYLADF